MNTGDESILLACLGYYMDEQAAVSMSKAFASNYENIYELERRFQYEMDEAKEGQIKKQSKELECYKEFLKSYNIVLPTSDPRKY